jgi:hypothetical protein
MASISISVEFFFVRNPSGFEGSLFCVLDALGYGFY